MVATIWFYIILFGGAILFVIFKGLFEDNALRNFIIFIGIVIAIVGIVFIFDKDDVLNIIGYIILTLVLVISITIAILVSKAKKQLAEKERTDAINKKIENEKLNRRKFYERCKKDGIETLSTESQKQRAILLAKEYGIDENNIKAIITQEIDSIYAEENAEKLKVEKEKNDKIQKQIDEKYNNDAKEQQKMLTPYPYYGQEKRIAVWQERLDKVNGIISALEQEIKKWSDAIDYASSSKHVNTVIQSKVDPYVAGGIGSAIGGAGAGMMAALDAQKENEKIERENEKNVKFLFESVTNFLKMKQQKEAERSEQLKFRYEYQDKIKEIELKLVDEIKIENPIDLLKIKNTEVTENRFSMDISLKKKAVIFGDVKAVIDGAFWAHIYQEKDYVGSVRVILPYEGLDTESVKITVDTSLGIKPNKKCNVEYEIEKLWLIEK